MCWRLSLIFALSIGYASAQERIPDTPAAQTLHAWLDAFNSGDSARMKAFFQKYGPRAGVIPDADVVGMMRLRDTTGNLKFLAIDKIIPADAESPISLYTPSFLTSAPEKWTHIQFRVQKTSLKTLIGELEVTDTAPARIVNLNFRGVQDNTLISLQFPAH